MARTAALVARHWGGRARAGAALILVTFLAAGTALAAGKWGGLSGLSLDTLFWLRERAFGPRHPADDAAAPVVVIAVDEPTYRTPPFTDTPDALWPPYLATVLEAVLAADPAVIGFDWIFPTTVSSALPDYERTFLDALKRAAQKSKIVMAMAKFRDPPLAPFIGQRIAVRVRGENNIRAVNLEEDGDGLVRRMPLFFARQRPLPGADVEPSFALELALRAGTGIPRRVPGQGLAIGDYAVPGSAADSFLLNFDSSNPKTLSLADVHACARSGNTAFFREHLQGKVVLIGGVLDVEDRKFTSRRFINRESAGPTARCITSGPSTAEAPGSGGVARTLMPGVYIHATAIENLLRREALAPLPPAGSAALLAGLAATAGAASFLPSVGLAAGLLGLLLAGALAGATLLFQANIATPMLEGLVAAVVAFALLVGYRLVATSRERARIRRMFGLYLAPSIVDRLVASGGGPELRGERRELSFLFSDIAGFTTLSERCDPLTLAPILNAYFEGVCTAILDHGGLVVEFVGDGVQAIFGAPAEQPDHAARAIACARAIDRFVEGFRAAQPPEAPRFGHTRIGVHTGTAMIGNFGSTRRLKYAALGDVVNTTSRIEGLNKFFGTRIAISEATRLSAGETGLRPLGRFVLKGRVGTLDIFELLDAEALASARIEGFRAAYADLEAGRADEAAAAFERLREAYPDDGCIAFYAERLARGERSPVIVMTEK